VKFVPFFLLGSGLAATGHLAAAPPALIWSDEFNQPVGTGPDPTKWNYDLGGSGWGNQELEVYTDARENSAVVADPDATDGKALAIIAVRTAAGGYTSARLKTQGLFTTAYGRIEARLKLPIGDGLWPAFWMLGDNIGAVGWPACGEIDIMENLGQDPTRVYGTLHGPGYSGAQGLQGAYTLPNGQLFSDDYHVFAVDWSPDLIEWSVDGHVYFTCTLATIPPGTRWVFNGAPFFLLLNLAVGGSWPGNPDATTAFPQTLYVDYVRVYALLTVSTLAGQAGTSGSANGTGSAAQFNHPCDVAVDSAGNVYVADTNNHTVRKITPAGVVTTLAGKAGSSGSADGTGTAAQFNHPSGVAVDSAGSVYVSDTDNDTIRVITSAGMVTTLAGQAGTSGSADGPRTAARFNGPSGIVTDTAGNLYVADTLNHTIRKVTSSGVVSTIAGMAGVSGTADGTGTAARFYGPQGLTLDGAGNLYVTDTNNDTIRKVVTSTSAVTTVAGLAGSIGSDDGPASQALFYYPSSVAVDDAGNLYVADTDNHTLRGITPSGVVSTIAGMAGSSGIADGVGVAARFNFPTGIAVDNTGNIYVADTNNHTIRLGIFPAAPLITTQPQSQTVTVGANVQFSVTASGKPAPSYQWYLNGTALSGATGARLSLANVQTTDAGSYTVTVINNSGTVTSSVATLTVNSAPVPPSSSGGGGGGGAMEGWFVMALAFLALVRARRFRPVPLPGRPNFRCLSI
jgi:beta-glucanase (GH16 family)